jgi:signal transduction histidine kinase/ActR/RegA family two-component response regulator
MVPTVIAALGSIGYVYQQERSNFDRGVAEAARALSLVVDRELASREAIVRTLSFSPTLNQPDLASFYHYASKVAPTDDTVVILYDTTGQQLVNTRRPLGAVLPRTSFASFPEAKDEQAAAVSDLYFAPLGKQFSFAVRVPVVRDGKTLYFISIGSFAKQLQGILTDQRLPAGWIGSVIDRKGVIVARSIDPDTIVGKSVSKQMLSQLSLQQEGAFESVSVDGTQVYASFSRSAAYGWGFIIGVPKGARSSAMAAAAVFGAFAMLFIAVALAGAARVGRKLVGPVTALVGAAEGLGQGEVLTARRTGLEETDKVAEAMAEASRSLRQSSETMERRVKDALAEAEKAQRAVIQNQRLEAMGHLTGGVAHDFNNLLMVVNNNTYLLRRTNPALDGNRQIASIERAVATGAKLTRQLLAFSRRQALRPEVIDLAERLPELLELIRASLSSAITVTCEVAAGTAPIEVDPAELELAIINLAVNARDAMDKGGTLSIHAGNAGPASLAGHDEPLIVIEVRDTGKGIEADVLSRVFEPFFTTKDVGHGTGLGLSQVYGFATQAGGLAKIDSEPGKGTAVRIFLPAALPRSLDSATEPVLPSRMSAKVLLVEDNAELGEVTQQVLTLAGCSVSRVTSGDEAVCLLQRGEHGIDVVLSDIRMPGATDGIALAEHLRQAYPGLPVVLMTGYSAELSKATERRLDVLHKPCTPQALVAALARVIALSRASG